MAPSDSNLIGNATIWNKDNEIGGGGEGFALTSQPYPVEFMDTLTVSGVIDDWQMLMWPIESVDVTGMLGDVALTSEVIYSTYEEWPPESIDVAGQLGEIELLSEVIYSTYEWPPESVNVAGKLGDVVLTQVVAYIIYENWPPESVNVVGHLGTIVLETA